MSVIVKKSTMKQKSSSNTTIPIINKSHTAVKRSRQQMDNLTTAQDRIDYLQAKYDGICNNCEVGTTGMRLDDVMGSQSLCCDCAIIVEKSYQTIEDQHMESRRTERSRLNEALEAERCKKQKILEDVGHEDESSFYQKHYVEGFCFNCNVNGPSLEIGHLLSCQSMCPKCSFIIMALRDVYYISETPFNSTYSPIIRQVCKALMKRRQETFEADMNANAGLVNGWRKTTQNGLCDDPKRWCRTCGCSIHRIFKNGVSTNYRFCEVCDKKIKDGLFSS